LSDPIVGIDLGTSNSVVAHAEVTGNVTVLADDAGAKVHPSVVSFHPGGGVVVGAAAKQRRVIDPKNTIYSVKRLIGRSYHSAEVQTMKARAPFQITEGPNGAPSIATRAGEFAVPEISAIVLDHVRNIADARLGVPVSRAVVTVPASFNDAQRSATATAGAIAGLTVIRVLNEPTAAALAYGHAQKLRDIIAVYDFGGGTFDITLLSLEDQVYEVLGTAGDTFLGGDDLDERLVEKMAARFLDERSIDLRTNPVAMMRLRAVAEQTKIELSRRARAVVRVDEIAAGPHGAPLNLQIELSRDEFVKEVADLIDHTFEVCSEALSLANLSVDRISDVILVGGTTKVPYVRDQVARFFGKQPRTDVSPEDAVAMGAALQATALARILARRASSKVRVSSPPQPAAPETTPRATDVLGLDPGAGPDAEPDPSYPVTHSKTIFGVPAGPALGGAAGQREIDGSRSSETTQARPITVTGTASPPPLPRSANPSAWSVDTPATTQPIAPPTAPTMAALTSEPRTAATARGIGAQTIAAEPSPADTAKGFQPPHNPLPPGPAALPTPAVPPRPPILLEVTPHGLGIATVAGFCEELIRRNSRVPAEIKKLFTTSRDQQDLVRIVVCQGESRRLDHNTVIGDLVLQNLPKRPRGETSIEVTFSIDPSGILHVRARDAATGVEQRAVLDLVGGVAQEDVASSRNRLQELQR
jgi:molecular chaperone DnaK